MGKINIEEIRLGISGLTNEVFAGKISKDGKRWLYKQNVTNDFIAAVVARWENHSEIISDEKHQWEITVKRLTK